MQCVFCERPVEYNLHLFHGDEKNIILLWNEKYRQSEVQVVIRNGCYETKGVSAMNIHGKFSLLIHLQNFKVNYRFKTDLEPFRSLKL